MRVARTCSGSGESLTAVANLVSETDLLGTESGSMSGELHSGHCSFWLLWPADSRRMATAEQSGPAGFCGLMNDAYSLENVVVESGAATNRSGFPVSSGSSRSPQHCLV